MRVSFCNFSNLTSWFLLWGQSHMALYFSEQNIKLSKTFGPMKFYLFILLLFGLNLWSEGIEKLHVIYPWKKQKQKRTYRSCFKIKWMYSFLQSWNKVTEARTLDHELSSKFSWNLWTPCLTLNEIREVKIKEYKENSFYIIFHTLGKLWKKY